MIDFKATNFKSSRKGLGKVLGRLEGEIMDVLWEGGPATGKQVLGVIRLTRDIAFTTVLTVLDRLKKKGIVKRTKGESGYIFGAVFTKTEFTEGVSREVLQGVIELGSAPAAASFVDILAEHDPEELERLARLIEEKKHELEGGTN